MILAAGRGERMRPLTDTTPKPLLPVAGKSLLEHMLLALASAGLQDVVINHAHLGEQIVQRLGDGRRYGLRITYSYEGAQGLETGGGIYQALPLLDSDPFVVINGDIWTDYPFVQLPKHMDHLAHLVLVPNPAHHPHGDFFFRDGRVRDVAPASHTSPEDKTAKRWTFSGIGVYRHALFRDCKAGKFPLAPLLRAAMGKEQVSGEVYNGHWWDIGTPARLSALDQWLREQGQP